MERRKEKGGGRNERRSDTKKWKRVKTVIGYKQLTKHKRNWGKSVRVLICSKHTSPQNFPRKSASSFQQVATGNEWLDYWLVRSEL